MNLNLMVEIARVAISIVNTHLEGTDLDIPIKTRLLEILQKAIQAYGQHAGEPLDPSLIKVEEPIKP